jgi:hypothetical protein
VRPAGIRAASHERTFSSAAGAGVVDDTLHLSDHVVHRLAGQRAPLDAQACTSAHRSTSLAAVDHGAVQ